MKLSSSSLRQFFVHANSNLHIYSRLLDMDFGPIIDKILEQLPKDRQTFLFSVRHLQRNEGITI